jgi:Uma2 family endonuclease
MSEALNHTKRYTRGAYLSMEDAAGTKHEFFDGEVFAMAGGSKHHSIICVNLMWGLREAVTDKDCIAFDGNMKLDIPKENAFVYPDGMVVCGEVVFSENRNDIITNPMLVIEVLSPATQAFDRGKKFKYYRSIPFLQEYVLISQEEPLVESYFRQDGKTWLYTVVRGIGDKVVLSSIAYEIALKEIYRKVIFEDSAVLEGGN